MLERASAVSLFLRSVACRGAHRRYHMISYPDFSGLRKKLALRPFLSQTVDVKLYLVSTRPEAPRIAARPGHCFRNGARVIHDAIQAFYFLEARRYGSALENPEESQRKCLQEILNETSQTPFGTQSELAEVRDYESFSSKFPVTDYESWRELIQKQRDSSRLQLNRDVQRYEPTSGSTGARKWIPYSRRFLMEMNRAAQAWISDLYRTYPSIKRGRHFWSLSWIPTELRGRIQTDDSELFPAWQRAILKKLLLSHPAIQLAPSGEAAWWATQLLLASCEDLSFVSVWSPTYLLGLCREMFANRELIAEALHGSRWVRFENDLNGFTPPSRKDFPSTSIHLPEFVQRLWPRLALISSWTSAASNEFVPELAHIFGSVPIQPKGLWATEGPITIPWQGMHPLAIRSHFYEFRCLASGKILPSWKLEKGQELQPILTTGSSLLRYELPDRVRVGGFAGKTPSLEFVGRLGGVDLVGEKMGFPKADEILHELRTHFPSLRIHCLGARKEGTQARYYAIGIGPGQSEPALAAALEKNLSQVHHYALARELRQLLPAGARLLGTLEDLSALLEKNQIRGQNKPNSICLLDS